MPAFYKLITQLSTNPTSFLAPQQEQARNQVDSDYAGAGDNLRQQFLTGGGGAGSGKYGKAVLSSDLARRGSLASTDSSFASQAAQLPLTAAQLMQQFLGMNFGSDTTSKASTTGGTTNASTGSTTDTGATSTTGGAQSTTNTTSQTDKTGSGSSVGFGASTKPSV